MDLTNRDLAENGTWITAINFGECQFCGFLSRNLELVKPSVPCPNCSHGGRPRKLFPDPSSRQYLKMVCHFYARAWERLDDTQGALVEKLRKALGQEYAVETAVNAALEVKRSFGAPDGSQEALDNILETIRLRLKLRGRDEAQEAFMPLAENRDRFEEHQMVVLPTAAMLEMLFIELLVRMLVVRQGMDWKQARETVRGLRRHPDREKKFLELTGVGFKDAAAPSGKSRFCASWKEIQKLRSDFMHGLPFVIQKRDAEEAFELAKGAFQVFAHLHNQFCVSVASNIPAGL